jgi:hypothetical protein
VWRGVVQARQASEMEDRMRLAEARRHLLRKARNLQLDLDARCGPLSVAQRLQYTQLRNRLAATQGSRPAS